MSAHEEANLSVEELDQAQLDAISALEAMILRLLEEQQPASWSDLRNAIAHAGLDQPDRRLVRTAMLRLLSTNQLRLSEDRPLKAAG